MSRWYPRRRTLSRKPENVQRRLTNRLMKVIAALVIAGGYWLWDHYFAAPVDPAPAAMATPAAQPAGAGPAPQDARRAAIGASPVDALYQGRTSNEMVTVSAPVQRVLADDREGDRHQRFTLALPSGLRLLVAHNIDLAPRVPGLAAGDIVTVRGEYEWDERGGVVHWTHHDPAGRHQGGWIEFQGRKYE